MGNRFNPNVPFDDNDGALPASLDWVQQELEFRQNILSNPYTHVNKKSDRKFAIGEVMRSVCGNHPYRVTAVDRPATVIVALEPITEEEYDRRLHEQTGNSQ